MHTPPPINNKHPTHNLSRYRIFSDLLGEPSGEEWDEVFDIESHKTIEVRFTDEVNFILLLC